MSKRKIKRKATREIQNKLLQVYYASLQDVLEKAYQDALVYGIGCINMLRDGTIHYVSHKERNAHAK